MHEEGTVHAWFIGCSNWLAIWFKAYAFRWRGRVHNKVNGMISCSWGQSAGFGVDSFLGGDEQVVWARVLQPVLVTVECKVLVLVVVQIPMLVQSLMLVALSMLVMLPWVVQIQMQVLMLDGMNAH